MKPAVPSPRGLPLLAKMLIPFIALTVAVGVLGVAFVTSDLADRAQKALDDDLSRRMVEARSFLHERELYALESSNYAANLHGMVPAIRAADRAAAARALESVLALKPELALVVAAGLDGVGIAEMRPTGSSTRPAVMSGGRWKEHAFVAEALVSRTGDRTVGTLAGSDPPMVAVAAPVCSGTSACEPVGVAIAGIPATTLLSPQGSESARTEGRAIFDANGRPLAARGLTIEPPRSSGTTRGVAEGGGREVAVLYAPFSLRGAPAGTIAIAVPTAPAFAAARDAAQRLGLILVLVIAGVTIVASLLARTITRRVRVLLETNRRLGAGEMSARADVRSRDEIGELAAGVNTMADQLQAAVETLELRVEQRTEEIRRLLDERTQFFASLSHEFRTPLAIILAQADRLEDPKPSRNGRRNGEITSAIRESAGQALQIVNDILGAAKAEAERVELRREPLDVPAFLRELKPTIEALAAVAGIRVELDVPASLPPASADRGRVREILLNLADNAVKYTPAGGRLHISATGDGSHVEISVADTGTGIPAHVGDRVFAPFYRVPGSEPQHGRESSGLGLALTRRLVDAHGGRIDYRCPPEGGTVFSFTLPVVS